MLLEAVVEFDDVYVIRLEVNFNFSLDSFLLVRGRDIASLDLGGKNLNVYFIRSW